MTPYARVCYRPTVAGWENLPRDRPSLLVANHSGGMAVGELTSFASLWVREFGSTRALTGFAHPIGFKLWPLTTIHRLLGSIPSTYEAAFAALDEGVPILMFPGGDHEGWRPVWQANRVDFGGRKGFLRIARKTRTTIVPMGITGSHYTAPVLHRSKLLPRLLVLPHLAGLKRWPVTVLGLVGVMLILLSNMHVWLKAGLVWAWLTSPAMLLPILPFTIRFRIGTPIDPEDLFDGSVDDGDADAPLDAALVTVQTAVQDLVTAEVGKR